MDLKSKNILQGMHNRELFRSWLAKNFNKKECFVPIKFGKPKKDGLYYLDAVEEAICFGWIDSVLKKDDSGRVIQRFSPRRKNSHWTYLNKQRAKRLIDLGKMTDHGTKNLPNLYEKFIIDEEILDILKRDKIFWEKFIRLPELYVYIKIDNILKVKNDKKVLLSKIERLIKYTKADKLYGNWNDFGRLS